VGAAEGAALAANTRIPPNSIYVYNAIANHSHLCRLGFQIWFKYVIQNVNSSDPDIQRLMVLGLVEGAEVELASAAIGGDPIEFRMFGNAISLRREHARQFAVTAAGEGG